MAKPLLSLGPTAVLERARAVLMDASRWTAMIAAYDAQRPNGPTIEQPKDAVIEFAPAEVDAMMAPQRFPAIRLFVTNTTTTSGLNAGVAESVHNLEVRILLRVQGRSTATSGLGFTISEAVLRGEAYALAVGYMLEMGLVDASIEVFDVAPLGVSMKGLVQPGDATFYRVAFTLAVAQTIRSGRFEHPITD